MDESLTSPEPITVFAEHRFERIVAKEFKSTLPPHLVAKLPEGERYTVEALSKLESQIDWMLMTIMKLNGEVMNLNERLISLERRGSPHTTILRAQLDSLQTQVNELKAKMNSLWDWKQFFSGKWAIIVAIAVIVLPLAGKFILDLVIKLIK